MSRAAGRPGTGSLGRRLHLIVAVQSLLLVAGAITMFFLQRDLESDLARATGAFVEEQWIQDRLGNAVLRQLVAATTHHHEPTAEVVDEFRAAGDEAQTELRRYLFRDLTPAQRRQLEIVKERHQQLEVAAAWAIELGRSGRYGDADDATRVMVDHGLALNAATTKLLSMREDDLRELRERQAARFRYLYWIGGALALLLLAGALAWGHFLHRRIARPLAEIGEAARRIGDGDLSVRVVEPQEEELAAVARSFNRMSDYLSAARSDLEDRNRQLRKAVARVHETHAELVQTEKLSAMGRMMAGLAHELNNPLSAVLGYGELLEDRTREADVPGEELRSEFVDPIVREAGRARELVHNLLRFTRSSEPLTLPVRLSDALDVVVRIRSFAFQQAGVALRIDEAADLWVIAEEQRLQQALLNVINNSLDAVEAARPENPFVRVRIEAHPQDVVVRVEDNGRGFSNPHRAFEPFYTTKPVGKGTGLGLAIVHRFMEEAGGTVVVRNRPTGGAAVTLTFRRADPAPARADEARPPELALPPSLRVLVVEDEAPLRKLEARLLDRIGARVHVAAGGYEARRILGSTPIDLIVSDVKMPEGDGLELFRWVEREHPELADRFLFVTGDVGDAAIAAIARARPDQFLNKPFRQAEYIRRVTRLATDAVTR